MLNTRKLVVNMRQEAFYFVCKMNILMGRKTIIKRKSLIKNEQLIHQDIIATYFIEGQRMTTKDTIDIIVRDLTQKVTGHK